MVEVIKLALHNIESFGMSGRKIIKGSIVYLWECYQKEMQKEYLEKAVCHAYAFMEMGYPYEELQKVMNPILNILEIDEGKMILRGGNRKISVSRANIRRVLGRWNPRLQSMKIEEAVSDILNKINENKQGLFVYHCGKVIQQNKANILWEKTYYLEIDNEDVIFHDVIKNRHYIFEKRGADIDLHSNYR